MKLIELELINETPTTYIFTIKVETTSFWGKPVIETIDCFRVKRELQSKFMSTGDCIFHKWLYLDNSINAILSKDVKMYKLLN